jgi:hypothetical protein
LKEVGYVSHAPHEFLNAVEPRMLHGDGGDDPGQEEQEDLEDLDVEMGNGSEPEGMGIERGERGGRYDKPGVAHGPEGMGNGKRKVSRKNDKPEKKRPRMPRRSAAQTPPGERTPPIPLIPQSMKPSRTIPILVDLDGEVNTETFILRLHC